MRTFISHVVIGALALVLGACDECETDEDCARIEVCAYFDSGPTECLPRCQSDRDCGLNGASCREKGSSCEDCEDVLMVCDVE